MKELHWKHAWKSGQVCSLHHVSPEHWMLLDLLSHLSSPKLQLKPKKSCAIASKDNTNRKFLWILTRRRGRMTVRKQGRGKHHPTTTTRPGPESSIRTHENTNLHVIHKELYSNPSERKQRRWAVLNTEACKIQMKDEESCLESHCFKCAQHRAPINGTAISKCCQSKSCFPYTQKEAVLFWHKDISIQKSSALAHSF